MKHFIHFCDFSKQEILTDLYSLSKMYADYSEKEVLFMGARGGYWKYMEGSI